MCFFSVGVTDTKGHYALLEGENFIHAGSRDIGLKFVRVRKSGRGTISCSVSLDRLWQLINHNDRNHG